MKIPKAKIKLVLNEKANIVERFSVKIFKFGLCYVVKKQLIILGCGNERNIHVGVLMIN